MEGKLGSIGGHVYAPQDVRAGFGQLRVPRQRELFHELADRQDNTGYGALVRGSQGSAVRPYLIAHNHQGLSGNALLHRRQIAGGNKFGKHRSLVELREHVAGDARHVLEIHELPVLRVEPGRRVLHRCARGALTGRTGDG